MKSFFFILLLRPSFILSAKFMLKKQFSQSSSSSSFIHSTTIPSFLKKFQLKSLIAFKIECLQQKKRDEKRVKNLFFLNSYSTNNAINEVKKWKKTINWRQNLKYNREIVRRCKGQPREVGLLSNRMTCKDYWIKFLD